MQELKACPFCGSNEAFLKYNGAKHGYFYYVECTICGGRTRGVCRPWRDVPSGTLDDPDEWTNQYAVTAKKLWNQRSDGNA